MVGECVKNTQSDLRKICFFKTGEQDGGGVGGRGVHLSPWIHQEYTLRHRSACRTPAESEGGNRTGSILKAGLHLGPDYGL